MNPEITIKPFQPEDQPEVKALILAGLKEHWGALDHSKNPDLDDIAQSYAGAVFLVARWGERVVGTGALVPGGVEQGEIVRMSVAADQRRQGVGRRILLSLVAKAEDLGLNRLVLETTDSWHDAIDFYQDYGFQITHYQDGDVFFTLDLTGRS